MKKRCQVAKDFLAKALFLFVAWLYIFFIYRQIVGNEYYFYIYSFSFLIPFLNFACVSIVLLIWSFAQKMEWRLVAEEVKLSKKTSRIFTLLFSISIALLAIWVIAHPLILSQTKIFGIQILFDSRLMFLTCLFWIVVWFLSVLFSSITTPVRLSAGYLLTGLCGFMGNTMLYTIYTPDEVIPPWLIFRNLIPVYLGAMFFVICFFLLKYVRKKGSKKACWGETDE